MKLKFLTVASIVALGVVLVIVLSSVFQPDQKTVRFGTGLTAVDYAPYYVAQNFGWYEKALKEKGYSTEHTVFQGPAPANEALDAGRVDIVVIAEPPVIIGRAGGIDQRIVALSTTLKQEILVRAGAGIDSIKDLKGRNVGVLTGSSSHYGLVRALQKNGVDPSDVKILNLLPPAAKESFETGHIDAWAIWPPWVEKEELAGTGTPLSGEGHVIQSLLIVRTGFYEENPELVNTIAEVHERSKEWIVNHPAEAQKIVAEALNEHLAAIEKSWPKHNWEAKLDADVFNDLQKKADFLLEQGIIENSVDVLKELKLSDARP